MARIYLDHGATTPLDQQVLQKMMPYFTDYFGNPSSVYREGQHAREALDDARLDIAEILQCSIDEIFFTSGATESNNLAIRGIIEAWKKENPHKKPHCITSRIEHSCVKNVMEDIEDKKIADITYIPVNKQGIVDIENIKKAITENTALVSIMTVNNEVGSIQPTTRIGRLCEKNNILFHTDAAQSVGCLPISVEKLKCSLMSLSGHKFYGPKGSGILYVKKGTPVTAQILGGNQERGMRSGTENVANAIGIASALQTAHASTEQHISQMHTLQKHAQKLLNTYIPNAIWNGPDIGEHRHPANIHFSLPEISGESFIMRMDLEGVSLSLGSACSSGLITGSHVLQAMNIPEELTSNGVRITMGKHTTITMLEDAFQKMGNIYDQLRV